MEKEFVPYKPSLDMKELGFDEPCFTYYWEDGVRYKGVNDPFNYNKQNVISAPTFSQAFRWFRKNQDINNCISYSRLEDNNWYYQYYKSGLVSGFKTYEEAELACLKKLIEICRELK